MAEFTPGPWQWYGNTECNSLYLATVNHGRKFVMQFKRWGMAHAQPMFQVKRGDYGFMTPASDLTVYEVGDRGIKGHAAAKADSSVYRYDVAAIDHPDARLICAAPDLFEACQLLSEAGDLDLEHEGYQDAVEIATQAARAALAKALGEAR